MKRRLSGRDSRKGKKFVEGVIEGKSYKQAALDAGYSLSVANNAKLCLWSQAGIQDHFRNLMQEVCPPARAMKILDELLDGKIVTIHIARELRATKVLQGERLVDGPEELIVVRADRTETTDNAGRERALRLVGEYGAFAPRVLQPFMAMTFEDLVSSDKEKPPMPTWLTLNANPQALTICGICSATLCAHGICLACERCCKDCSVSTLTHH
jgi:hypothetical protein